MTISELTTYRKWVDLMEDKLPCQRHGEQIKTLFKRVDSMDKLNDIIHNLDKNMVLQTQLMKNVVDHNAKQDDRADAQQEIIVKINSNLTELNEGQKVLNKRVGKLEERVDENEEKHSIDTRNIDKDRYLKKIYKVITPIGIGAILAFVIELIKVWKG